MAQIKLKKNYINLDLVDENNNVVEVIKFNKTDENIDKFWNKYKDVSPIEADEIEKQGLEGAKNYLKEIMDDLFEEGTFDRLYKINPSILILSAYFVEFTIAIRNELEEESRADITAKYLKKAR